MEIKWANLIAFAMLLTAIVIVLTMRSEIFASLRTMGDIGPSHSDEERTMGLIAFGIVGILIVAVVRIVVSAADGERSGKE